MKMFALAIALVASKRVSVQSPDHTIPSWTSRGIPNGFPDLTVQQGDTIIFKFSSPWHDVAQVDSADKLNNCDAGEATQLVNDDGTLGAQEGGVVTMEGSAVTYEFTPPAAGTYYILCSKGDGASHCNAGLKFTLTVKPALSATPIGEETPRWSGYPALAEGYADMTVPFGDAILFEYTSPYHNVALVPADTYEDCSFTTFTELIKANGSDPIQGTATVGNTSDSSFPVVYKWTPPAPGDYYIACTKGGEPGDNTHCNAKLKMKVTVTLAGQIVGLAPIGADATSWTSSRGGAEHEGYADVTVNPGDTLHFKFYSPYHNVALVAGENFDECDFGDKITELVGSGAGWTGNEISQGTATLDGHYMQYYWTPAAKGVYYVACSLGEAGAHCNGGKLKVKITVADPPQAKTRSGWTGAKPVPNYASELEDITDAKWNSATTINVDPAKTDKITLWSGEMYVLAVAGTGKFEAPEFFKNVAWSWVQTATHAYGVPSLNGVEVAGDTGAVNLRFIAVTTGTYSYTSTGGTGTIEVQGAANTITDLEFNSAYTASQGSDPRSGADHAVWASPTAVEVEVTTSGNKYIPADYELETDVGYALTVTGGGTHFYMAPELFGTMVLQKIEDVQATIRADTFEWMALLGPDVTTTAYIVPTKAGTYKVECPPAINTMNGVVTVVQGAAATNGATNGHTNGGPTDAPGDSFAASAMLAAFLFTS